MQKKIQSFSTENFIVFFCGILSTKNIFGNICVKNFSIFFRQKILSYFFADPTKSKEASLRRAYCGANKMAMREEKRGCFASTTALTPLTRRTWSCEAFQSRRARRWTCGEDFHWSSIGQDHSWADRLGHNYFGKYNSAVPDDRDRACVKWEDSSPDISSRKPGGHLGSALPRKREVVELGAENVLWE